MRETNELSAGSVRRHDLDALRAAAMLLGLLLHSLMSFLPGVAAVWPVQDAAASWPYGLILAAIHGWRMPLFFLISGFFTAMLWHKRGLSALLIHRARRILLPLIAGMCTIVPIMGLTLFLLTGSIPTQGGNGIFAAVVSDDIQQVQQYIKSGEDLDVRDSFGSTPLHVACFFGRTSIASLLLNSDASREIRNNDGLLAEHLLDMDWSTTSAIAGIVGVDIEQNELLINRSQIRQMFAGEEKFAVGEEFVPKSIPQRQVRTVQFDPFRTPVFHHLWFLWFLCWLVPIFAVFGRLLAISGVKPLACQTANSPLHLLWLVPLTATSLLLMPRGPQSFGPETSLGLIPLPSVLFCYAIFFGFGMLTFNADGRGLPGASRPLLYLVVASLLLFPAALALRSDSSTATQVVVCLLEAAYAWSISLGLIGLFHKRFSCETPLWRYVSDASYWLYLVHIPLVWVLQSLVSDVALPSPVKLLIVCSLTTILLLLLYHCTVRSTWLGLFLNGRRYPRIPLRNLFTRSIVVEQNAHSE